MRKPYRVSIKVKILILLTVLPLLALGLYLYISVGIFEKDKVQYVYDSSGSVARSVGAQTKAEMVGLLNLIKPIIQDYVSTQSLGSVATTVFNNEAQLLGVGIYKPMGGGFVRQALQEKSPGLFESYVKQVPQMSVWLQSLNGVPRIVRAPFEDERVVLLERVGKPGDPNFFVVVCFYHAQEFADVFRAPGANRLFLVSEGGEILFGAEKEVGQSLKSIAGEAFVNKIAKSKVISGVETVKDKKGLTLLSSYSRAGFGDLIVVSFVDKALALSAVKILLSRSLIFFGLLIFATMIVSIFASNSLTSALTDLAAATRRVAEGHFDFRVKVQSKDEVGNLAESFNIMAQEVSRLVDATAEKARMEGELKTAQTVQETLFPPAQSFIGGLDIFGSYEPASECGGDWWYYNQIGSKVFLWIGDATGHGAPAALITSAARSASSIIERLSVSPATAMNLLNQSIYDVSKGKLMMTFFIASYDQETKALTYCNASHEGPFLIKKADRAPKKKDLIPLNEVNNARLGQDRETTYSETSIVLDTGDLVLFYTDGITDLRNPQDESLGEREFIKAITEAAKDFPRSQTFVERFGGRLREHRQNTTLVDDVTYFVIRVEG